MTVDYLHRTARADEVKFSGRSASINSLYVPGRYQLGMQQPMTRQQIVPARESSSTMSSRPIIQVSRIHRLETSDAEIVLSPRFSTRMLDHASSARRAGRHRLSRSKTRLILNVGEPAISVSAKSTSHQKIEPKTPQPSFFPLMQTPTLKRTLPSFPKPQNFGKYSPPPPVPVRPVLSSPARPLLSPYKNRFSLTPYKIPIWRDS